MQLLLEDPDESRRRQDHDRLADVRDGDVVRVSREMDHDSNVTLSACRIPSPLSSSFNELKAA